MLSPALKGQETLLEGVLQNEMAKGRSDRLIPAEHRYLPQKQRRQFWRTIFPDPASL